MREIRERGKEKGEKKEGWEDTRHGLQRALYTTNECDETNSVHLRAIKAKR